LLRAEQKLKSPETGWFQGFWYISRYISYQADMAQCFAIVNAAFNGLSAAMLCYANY